MVRSRAWLALLVLLAAALALASCSGGRDQAPAREIRVGWAVWPGWYPMAIAQELHLFEKHGAAIRPVLYDNYTAIFSDFAGGVLQGATGGLYELLKVGLPGMKVVLLTDYSEGGEGLVTIPSVKTPADLVGKRIGIQGALSGSEFLITTLLRRHGLSRNDLTFVQVEPESVLDEIPSRVDGGYTWQPFLGKARERGLRVLFTTADVPGMIPDVVAFQGAVASEDAASIRGFLAAWFEAQQWWRRNPAEAAALIAKVTGVKPEEVSLEGCRMMDRQGNLMAFQPGPDAASLHFTGAEQIRFFVSVGDASKAPNLADILDPSFLK